MVLCKDRYYGGNKKQWGGKRDGSGRKKTVGGVKNVCLSVPQILIPDVPQKSDSSYQKLKKHKLFCKRAGIEPTIGHIKSDYRLGRNFYKGVVGDSISILSAAAYNLKRAMKVLLTPISELVKKVFEMLFCNSISVKYNF